MANPTRARPGPRRQLKQAALGITWGTLLFAVALLVRFAFNVFGAATTGEWIGYGIGAFIVALVPLWLGLSVYGRRRKRARAPSPGQ
jgi:uncharacterized PurR-regulated membrane protein YhhQ (DUF165 family)